MFKEHKIIISPYNPPAGCIKHMEVFYDLKEGQMPIALSK